MHRIAKDGHGYFAYCRKASQIPKFVAEALSQTQRIVGTNAKLVFQGLGCSILSKIYKHKNNVALLNDLKQNNSITIACKMKSMPTHQTPDVEDVLKWKLSYINAITGGVEESEGMVKAEFTSDLDSAQQPGDAPANACVSSGLSIIFYHFIFSFLRFCKSRRLCLTARFLLVSTQTIVLGLFGSQSKQSNIWKKLQFSILRDMLQ